MFHILMFFHSYRFLHVRSAWGDKKISFRISNLFRLGFSFSHILFCWTWQNISNWSLFEHIFTCAFDLQPVIWSENIRLFDKYNMCKTEMKPNRCNVFSMQEKSASKILVSAIRHIWWKFLFNTWVGVFVELRNVIIKDVTSSFWLSYVHYRSTAIWFLLFNDKPKYVIKWAKEIFSYELKHFFHLMMIRKRIIIFIYFDLI